MSRVYFTDRDLGKQFPNILRSAGMAVEAHSDHFPANASDEEWLRAVSARRWVVLTHDRRIRYKANERDAVMQNGIAMLVIVGAAPLPELAQSFVAMTRRVESFLDRNDPPFIARVYRPSPSELARDPAALGRVELWVSHLT